MAQLWDRDSRREIPADSQGAFNSHATRSSIKIKHGNHKGACSGRRYVDISQQNNTTALRGKIAPI